MARVQIYIDGANFYNGCRAALGRADVRIGDFVLRLCAGRELRRAYYYNCPLPVTASEAQHRAQQGFYNSLKRTPYLEVRLGRLVRRSWTCDKCGQVHERWLEKGVDMRIGIDMLSHAVRDHYDVAILVSGDGDFADAIHATKETGKHVEVACFSSARSDALLQASDLLHELEPSFFSGLFVR